MAADVSRPPVVPQPMRAIGFAAWGTVQGLLWTGAIVLVFRHFLPLRVFSGVIAGAAIGAVVSGVLVARLGRLLQLCVAVGAVLGGVRVIAIVGTAASLPGGRDIQLLVAAFVALGLVATGAICGIVMRRWHDVWRWLLAGVLFPSFIVGVLVLANRVIPDDQRTFFPRRRFFPFILIGTLPAIALTASLGLAGVPPRRWVQIDDPPPQNP